MSIRILVNGARGRMGSLAVHAIQEDRTLSLVGQSGRGDDLAQVIDECNPDVVIDLTNADVVFKHAQIIIEAGCHPVIGSSGLQGSEIQILQDLSQKKMLGGVIAPNFSIAAVLMIECAKRIALFYPQVEIIEQHHTQKMDSPSGTALHTAEAIAHARKSTPRSPQTKSVIPHARGAEHHQIPIHSIRLPGIVAKQQIIFGGTAETLTLEHQSIDRLSFMPGLLMACHRVIHIDYLANGLDQLLYELRDEPS